MEFKVVSVKEFTGSEGYGYNAMFTADGVKIGLASDMADGGPVRYDWDRKYIEAFSEAAKKAGKFNEYTGADEYVEDMVNDFSEAKKIEKLKRAGKFVFRVNGSTDIQYFAPRPGKTLPPAEKLIEKLDKDYGKGNYTVC